MTLKKWIQDISGQTARAEMMAIIDQHHSFQNQIAKLVGHLSVFNAYTDIYELQDKATAEILSLCESDALAKNKEVEPHKYDIPYHCYLLKHRADLALELFRRLRKHGFIESGDLYLGNVKAFEHVSSEKVLNLMKDMLGILKHNRDQDFRTMAFRLFDLVALDVSSMIESKEKRKEFIIKVREHKILHTLEVLDGTDFREFSFEDFVRYYDSLSFYEDSFHCAYPQSSQVNGIRWQSFEDDTKAM